MIKVIFGKAEYDRPKDYEAGFIRQSFLRLSMRFTVLIPRRLLRGASKEKIKMKKKTTVATKTVGEKSAAARVAETGLKIITFLVVLEPIWMVLPFAGFLYGSVLPIELLNRSMATSWLVHFVFPAHTFFPLGLILIAVGLLIFLVGMIQIYSAKLFKKGLVTSGIYKKFRHPQYVGFTIFGFGVLLTWGRFITFIAFFIMMWLYYFLAKSEERKCFELFGEEYKTYCQKTYFLFPGEKMLSTITAKIHLPHWPTWSKAAATLVIVIGISLGTGFLIQKMRAEFRNTIPVIEGSMELPGNGADKVELVMVKGPLLQAAPSDEIRDRMIEKFFEMLVSSTSIKQKINSLNLEKDHVLFAFLTPGSNWHSGDHRDYRSARVNAFIFIVQTPQTFTEDNFAEFQENMQVLKLVVVQEMGYQETEGGLEPVIGEIRVVGPPLGIESKYFKSRMDERIDFFLSGIS